MRSFGRARTDADGKVEDLEGVSISFCTCRFSSLTPADIANLQRLILPLMTRIRVATDKILVTELMETYQGRISGRRVYKGRSERGDGEVIQSVLMVSGLRNSVAISGNQNTWDHLQTLNVYFDFTVNAVVEHGGEVLKFMRDGILAIFPIDETKPPRAEMCAAALSAAREAFAHGGHTNAKRTKESAPRSNLVRLCM